MKVDFDTFFMLRLIVNKLKIIIIFGCFKIIELTNSAR